MAGNGIATFLNEDATSGFLILVKNVLENEKPLRRGQLYGSPESLRCANMFYQYGLLINCRCFGNNVKQVVP